ncbi:rhomboid family intramembrane serine protease [Pararhodobacter sp. CCB-MM2]|uniref:rhomboid family intramembrane serine protease n=1 Tax=Pararhodobacter sp. CCB-MM2 TaxID=1786003 RepID=UPI00082EC38A|nr:rhomboid family intramembrane serine protease [Pararhodobacter sp. CCB-MM2]
MTDDDDQLLRDLNSSPLNRLPGAVWLLLLAVLGIELVFVAAHYGLVGGAQGVGWRLAAIERFAFSGAIQQWMLENMRFPASSLWRYATYSFVHATTMSAIFAAVLIAALGKMLGERFGTLPFLLLALVTPVLAAMIFGLVVGDDQLGWLVGSMPMVFALVGGFTWMRFHDAQGDREKQKRAFSMIGLLLVARLAFGLVAEAGPGWIGEVAAFALGYGASALILGPGSWQRTRARIQR